MWYPRSQRSQKSILSSSAGSWKWESCKMQKICNRNCRTKTIIALSSRRDLPDTSCTVCSPCTPTRSWWRNWSGRGRGQHRSGGTSCCTSSSAAASPAGIEVQLSITRKLIKLKNCCQRLLHFAQQLTCPALLWFMLPWHILQMALGRISSTFFIGPFVSFFVSSFTFSCFSFTSFRGRPLANKNKWRVVSENLTF